MEYYVSDLDNNHIATIVGDDQNAIEDAFDTRFSTNDFFGTYSPAFGAVGGLVENPEAEVIYA